MAIPKDIRELLDAQALDYRRRKGELAIRVASTPVQVDTTLAYEEDTETLSWTARLLKGKKERQAFTNLIATQEDMWKAFQTLGLALTFGEMGMDDELGPIVRIRWPRCAINEASLRRAHALMQDAATLAVSIRGALDGGEMEIALDEVLAFRHLRPDWRPEETEAESHRKDAYPEHEDSPQAIRERQRHLDRRLLEVHEALLKGDLRLARSLATEIGTSTPSTI